MKMFKKNKKGMFGLTDLVSILVIALILIVFWMIIYFSSLSAGDKIVKTGAESNSYIGLLNFLRTPVEFNGEKMNVGEFFSLVYSNENEEEFSEKKKEVFSYLDRAYDCYGFDMYINDIAVDSFFAEEKCKKLFGGFHPGRFEQYAEQPIPLKDGKILKIVFGMENKNE